ncbi:hypothetical protein EYF80_061240 [Liparis tanakae]|uniref:Uncharacterized protein n=1 Tax=Liparis tanakae TaxID=230148 RepID=A0A4Z2EIF5_9TELE|nr:hypothetical protein EYF80_061240 [Liparis tanakae]
MDHQTEPPRRTTYVDRNLGRLCDYNVIHNVSRDFHFSSNHGDIGGGVLRSSVCERWRRKRRKSKVVYQLSRLLRPRVMK